MKNEKILVRREVKKCFVFDKYSFEYTVILFSFYCHTY